MLKSVELDEAGHGGPEVIAIDEGREGASIIQGQGQGQGQGLDPGIGTRLIEEGDGKAFAVIGENTMPRCLDAASGPAFKKLAEVDHQAAFTGRHVMPASVRQLRLQAADTMLLEQGDEAGIDMRLTGQLPTP